MDQVFESEFELLIEQGDKATNQNAHKNERGNTPTIALYGNRCGHDPESPRYFKPPETHKLRPDVIQTAINNLKHFYDNPQKWLKSLRLTRDSAKQERSEGREGDAQVLGVLLHYTELVSLRVGFYDEFGSFVALDMGFIARRLGWQTDEDKQIDRELVKLGLPPKRVGVQRVWRAMARLKRAGYINIKRQYKIEKNGEKTSYKGRAAIRTLSQKAFKDLGVSLVKLELKRKEAVKRLKKKSAEMIQKAEALVGSIKRVGGNVSKPIARAAKKLAENLLPKYVRGNEQNARELNEQRCRLKLLPENTGLSSEDFYKKYPHLRPRLRL